MAIVDSASVPYWRSLVSYNGGKNSSEPLRTNLPYNNSGNASAGARPARPAAQMGMSIVRKTITISALTFMQLCAVNPPKCINLINSIFGNFFINTTTNLDTTISNFVEFYSNGNKDPTTWDDVIGMDLACQDIKQKLDIIGSQSVAIRARRAGANPPRNILLIGPPGTGKTLMAKAAANHLNAPLLVVSAAEIVKGKYAGIGVERIKALFKSARRIAKKTGMSMVFIDELDSCGRSRGGDSSVVSRDSDNTLNQLLVELDGFKARHENQPRVIVMAATNRYDVLDSALVRKGRFDNVIHLGFPDVNGRYKLYKHYINKHWTSVSSLEIVFKNKYGTNIYCQAAMPESGQRTTLKILSPKKLANLRVSAYMNESSILFEETDLRRIGIKCRNIKYNVFYNGSKINDDVDVEKLANLSPGLAGADIEAVVNEAVLSAMSDGKSYADNSYFERALEDNILGKPIYGDGDESAPPPDWRIAVHEAGHVLASFVLKNIDNAVRASIRPRSGGSLGVTMFGVGDIRNLRALELRERLIMMLSGKAAESYVFDGDTSTGASDDVFRASLLANNIIKKFAIEGASNAIGGKAANAAIIAEIDKAEYLAAELVKNNKDILNCIAQILFEYETVNGHIILKKCFEELDRPEPAKQTFLNTIKTVLVSPKKSYVPTTNMSSRRLRAAVFILSIVFAGG